MSEQPCYPDLDGKIAVVTGGSRGIGAATAQQLADNGVGVAVVGRDHDALEAVVGAITTSGGRAIGVAADCTDPLAVTDMYERVSAQLGPVDILAAFAGGNGMPVPTEMENLEHWREVLDSDLNSAFIAISGVLPSMLERGTGVIITMASAAARQPAQSSAAYAAAKAGVIALTRHLAVEVGPRGVRLNCIAPSAVVNDRMRAWVPEDERREMGESFPLRRLGEPEDIAGAACFLASTASSWITGVTLDISGGKVIV
jgi:3-oxoacyl-[acyl-carrier protein] reductase